MNEMNTEKSAVTVQVETKKTSLLKPAMFVIWLGLLGAIWYAIDNVDSLFIRSGDSLAELTLSNGKIEYRPSNVALWFEASSSQEFFDGDFVSTAGGASARIVFSDGRSIDLDENSQILISKPKNNVDGDLIVDLLSGHVVAKIAPRPKALRSKPVKKLIVKSLEKKFVLASSDNAFGLSKKTESKKAKITGIKGKVIQTEKDVKKVITRKIAKVKAPPRVIRKEARVKPVPRVTMKKPRTLPRKRIKLASNKDFKLPDTNVLDLGSGTVPIFTAPIEEKKIEPPKFKRVKKVKKVKKKPVEKEASPEIVVKATPIPEPKIKIAAIPKADIKPKFDHRKFMPTLQTEGYVALWTLSSFNSGEILAPIMVTVNPPRGRKLSSWTPVVKIRNEANKGKSRSVSGKKSYSTQAITIKPNIYRSKASKILHPFYQGVAFTASSGARLVNSGKSKTYFGSSKQKYKLYSLADFAPSPATVHLNSLSFDNKKSRGWIRQRSDIPKGSGHFAISFASAKNIRKLGGIIGGDFSISPGLDGFRGAKTFFVKNGKIFGSVKGSALNNEHIVSLIGTLGANLAFKGALNKYKKLPSSTSERRKTLKSLLKKNGRITVVTADTAFEVSKTILTKKQKLLTALSKKALGYLPKGVEIIR